MQEFAASGGAVIIISHDRWMLSRCATRIFALKETKTLDIFDGGWMEYENSLHFGVGCNQLDENGLKSIAIAFPSLTSLDMCHNGLSQTAEVLEILATDLSAVQGLVLIGNLFSRILQAASDAREAVVIVSYLPTLTQSFVQVMNTPHARASVIAHFYLDGKLSKLDKRLKSSWYHKIAISASASTSPSSSTSHQCTVELLAGGAFRAGPPSERVLSPINSEAKIYRGPLHQHLIGAEFLLPYYPKGTPAKFKGAYPYSVVSYNAQTRLYGGKTRSSVTTPSESVESVESSSSSSSTSSTSLEELDDSLEWFTFAQLSMMGVGHAVQWYIGKENDKLVDVAQLFSNARQSSFAEGLCILICTIITKYDLKY